MFGQAYGMAPVEYYLKMFDLRNQTEGRDLIHVKVNSFSCVKNR